MRPEELCACSAMLKPEDFTERVNKYEPMWSWRARAAVAALGEAGYMNGPTRVWVLDQVGYDARGGQAEIYSTLEKAKASKPNTVWVEVGEGVWEEKLPDGSIADLYVIKARIVDSDA